MSKQVRHQLRAALRMQDDPLLRQPLCIAMLWVVVGGTILRFVITPGVYEHAATEQLWLITIIRLVLYACFITAASVVNHDVCRRREWYVAQVVVDLLLVSWIHYLAGWTETDLFFF
jgi:hypothetical protein